MSIFKKKLNPYDEFQIVVAQLQAKQKSCQNLHKIALRQLCNSFEYGTREDIILRTKEEYKAKQTLEFVTQALTLSRNIRTNFKFLFSDHPSQKVQEQYAELSNLKCVVDVPELLSFLEAHPVPLSKPDVQMNLLGDAYSPSYLQQVCSQNPISPYTMSRVEQLFPLPPPIPQYNTQLMYPPPQSISQLNSQPNSQSVSQSVSQINPQINLYGSPPESCPSSPINLYSSPPSSQMDEVSDQEQKRQAAYLPN